MRTGPTRLPLLAIVGITLTAAAVAGCSTQGEKSLESFAQTRKEVDEARRQVDVTLVSLHALRGTPTAALKDNFRGYREAVEDLEEQGEEARQRATALKERTDSHVRAWESEMKSIKDPAIKASLEDRKRAVRSNFELFKMYAQDARKAYEPYLAGNKDIVRALSIDLSAGAISSLSPSIDKVLLDGKELQGRLGAMQRALDNIAAGVSPLGPMD